MLGRRGVMAMAVVVAAVLMPDGVWSQSAPAMPSIAGVGFERASRQME